MYYPDGPRIGAFFSQQDAFLDKDLTPAQSDIPAAERPICHALVAGIRILRLSGYIKQPDVLMGLYFLNHVYDTETLRRNFDFYAPLTLHESGLSPCIHSIMAAQLGEKDLAVAMYKRTARYDLDNINQDSQDGLHITSMSGSVAGDCEGLCGRCARLASCVSNRFCRIAGKWIQLQIQLPRAHHRTAREAQRRDADTDFR